eukprot:gnl/MRDRNA2_/MRDRNA2_62092_c0_seq2.p2 gnl/MRDRNA2_/MRDRNA2_62092_c0~~gnl/MRDRNA2_/MRDRNA2_62092_c0_seq2.p2  ORF type:complete len:130 (-),score=24.10 gnl/MRDRNA2_/MRDRNA2_62092_c0_seq2:101-490(-)
MQVARMFHMQPVVIGPSQGMANWNFLQIHGQFVQNIRTQRSIGILVMNKVGQQAGHMMVVIQGRIFDAQQLPIQYNGIMTERTAEDFSDAMMKMQGPDVMAFIQMPYLNTAVFYDEHGLGVTIQGPGVQ